jgi:hypothetical protein
MYGMIFTFVRPSKSCGPWRFQPNFSEDKDEQFSILNQLNQQLNYSFPDWLDRVIEVFFSTEFMVTLAIFMV